MVPMADGLLPRISCSLLFGVRSSFWMAADGGWLLWCASLCSEDRRLPVPTKKKNSSGRLGLVVISCFIWGPFHKKGVYYAYFHLIYGCILFHKKKWISIIIIRIHYPDYQTRYPISDRYNHSYIRSRYKKISELNSISEKESWISKFGYPNRSL